MASFHQKKNSPKTKFKKLDFKIWIAGAREREREITLKTFFYMAGPC